MCVSPGAGSPDHGCVPYPSPSPSFTFAPTHSLAPTSTCEDTCYSQTCDYWAYYGYTCTTLEDTYGCDCSGCCAPTTRIWLGGSPMPSGVSLTTIVCEMKSKSSVS